MIWHKEKVVEISSSEMSLRYKVNMYRRYFKWKKSGVIFIHVPKAAGTSVNLALYGRTMGHYSAQQIRDKFPVLYDKSFVFSLVRNPWDRILSAYRFAKVGRTKDMAVKHPEQYKVPEFDSFERFLNEWLINKDVTQLDYIFKPQKSFLFSNDEVNILDFLGKVECFSSSLGYVEEKVGRRLALNHSNRTAGTTDYRAAYTSNDMIELVRNIYKQDVEEFGYDFE